MKLKNILFFVSIISILTFYRSFAFQITKVSGPASYPWIEIYNDSDIVKDITGYKVFDSGAATNGHTISTTNISTSFSIPANSYFIVAKDETRPALQNISCPVFHSSLGIKIGDNILFKKSEDVTSFNVSSLETLSSTSCSSGNNSGGDTSTSSNSTSTNSTSTNSNGSTTINTVYIYVPTNNQNKYGDINVLLPSEKVVPVGADVDYTVKVTDLQKNLLTGLDFNWSFGDGGEKFGKTVSYHYVYPGDYTLIASADGFTSGGEAKMKVTAVKPNIIISKVGVGRDENFIDLKNDTDYDLFLSDFYLQVNGEYFKLPKKFIISKAKTVHISGEALGFKLPAINVSLHYPNKTLLVKYEEKVSSSSIVSLLTNININIATDTKVVDESKNTKILNIENDSIIKANKNINSESESIKEVKKVTDYNNQDLIFKKLIFLENTNKIFINKNIEKTENVKKSENVDTGIINWLKSLIY